jgi:PIN domain nuclease of toxin-antitoxin system
MEAVAHLDTPVLVWLYAGALERIPAQVREQLETHALVFSPAARLELQFLFEIRRIADTADTVIADLERRIELRESDVPFPKVVSIATALTWTRDPFDRLIVAQAQAQRAPLITADGVIRKHFKGAIWGRVKAR